jgi:hypothetical protein
MGIRDKKMYHIIFFCFLLYFDGDIILRNSKRLYIWIIIRTSLVFFKLYFVEIDNAFKFIFNNNIEAFQNPFNC